jgi:hypothetical protein
MQGTVAGTPGTAPTNWSVSGSGNGLTREIVGVGVEKGITYIDLRYFGTATANSFVTVVFESATQIAALSGQSWTSSVYLKISNGSTTGVNSFNHWLVGANSVGGPVETSTVAITPTTEFSRVTLSRTLTGASTAFVYSYLDFLYSNGAAIDITLRIGLPQLELGATATSVIPTTTASATRSADIATVTGSNFASWYRADEGTLFADYIVRSATTNHGVTAISDGSTNNRMIIRAINSSSQTVFIGISSGSTQWFSVIVGAATNTDQKSVFAYKVDDIAWARNAGTVGTDTTAIIPVVNQLRIGTDGDGTSALNGTIKRIAYYPTRLSDQQLQSLTL